MRRGIYCVIRNNRQLSGQRDFAMRDREHAGEWRSAFSPRSPSGDDRWKASPSPITSRRC